MHSFQSYLNRVKTKSLTSCSTSKNIYLHKNKVKVKKFFFFKLIHNIFKLLGNTKTKTLRFITSLLEFKLLFLWEYALVLKGEGSVTLQGEMGRVWPRGFIKKFHTKEFYFCLSIICNFYVYLCN